jgi:hypothetical protein
MCDCDYWAKRMCKGYEIGEDRGDLADSLVEYICSRHGRVVVDNRTVAVTHEAPHSYHSPLTVEPKLKRPFRPPIRHRKIAG